MDYWLMADDDDDDEWLLLCCNKMYQILSNRMMNCKGFTVYIKDSMSVHSILDVCVFSKCICKKYISITGYLLEYVDICKQGK